MKFNLSLIAMTLCASCVSVANAQEIDDFVVYIECTKEGQPPSRGTGVMVSSAGHVLTAKHVVPDGYECKGVLGNATLPLRGLIRDPRSVNIDATLLRFVSTSKETFPSVKFCKLDQTLKGQQIFATGFPGGNSLGQPSSRSGVISSTISNEKGIIETDVQTTRGMSGGPVTLGNGSSLIGIVSGAEFDPGTGQPNFFGVLAAEVIADTFKLVEAPSLCPASPVPEKP